MEWRDEGILLQVRRHGESAAIIEALTATHGRHAGVVRGGAGRRMSPVLQPGAQLDLTWRARLPEHLGHFTVEPIRQRAAGVLEDRLALAALASVCALLHAALPERAPQPVLYAASIEVLDSLGAPGWLGGYIRWELALLEQAGYGLDLSCCALTGARAGLGFVSPRSGRAVSHGAAAPWAGRLLPLPPALIGQGTLDASGARDALRLTGHFLQRHLGAGDGALPEARSRLERLVARP